MGVAAFLNVLAAGLAGFASDTVPLLVLAVVFVLAARVLSMWRKGWVLWILFLTVLALPVVTMMQLGGGHTVPDWMFLLVIAAELLCAMCLFVALWRGPDGLLDAG